MNPQPTAPCEFRAEGERWNVAGALTFGSAARALASSTALPLPASGVVACEGITAVDSAAVAVLLAIARRAQSEARPLLFAGMPPALVALADLYGVDDIVAG